MFPDDDLGRGSGICGLGNPNAEDLLETEKFRF